MKKRYGSLINGYWLKHKKTFDVTTLQRDSQEVITIDSHISGILSHYAHDSSNEYVKEGDTIAYAQFVELSNPLIGNYRLKVHEESDNSFNLITSDDSEILTITLPLTFP